MEKKNFRDAISLLFEAKDAQIEVSNAGRKGSLTQSVISLNRKRNLDIERDEQIMKLLAKLEAKGNVPQKLLEPIADIIGKMFVTSSRAFS
jgi:type III secretion system FlhB-like substrate exporter